MEKRTYKFLKINSMNKNGVYYPDFSDYHLLCGTTHFSDHLCR